MPAKRKNKLIQCRFYEWKIFERNGRFYADGRAGINPCNRHSLSANNLEDALRTLHQLDLVMA
ncbi:MAG: site-specific integrase, partial [Planctomycetota bacterium]